MNSGMWKRPMGGVVVVVGVLALVFGFASLLDVARDLLGEPTPSGKDYLLAPLLSILGGLLTWRGVKMLRSERSESDNGASGR